MRDNQPDDQATRREPEGEAGTVRVDVPDYELLRTIGSGAYGEVWLAKNVMGTFRAVKIVFRNRFKEDGPYEREFNGIRKFETTSGTHPGLLNILHVGRNDHAGCFYYMMELADDESGEPVRDPQAYRAKTLAGEIKRRKRLPVEECVALGASLAGALEHLHQRGLVHRDVKPANIIFVKGVPKLADIGLVTEIGPEVSLVYTPGYNPPEGPGQPTADVFSLGRMLYVMASGKTARDFPELPTDLAPTEIAKGFAAFNRIMLKAGASRVEERHQSAGELRADLEAIQSGGTRLVAPARRRLSRGSAIIGLAVLALLAAGALLWTRLQPRSGLAERLAGLPAAQALQVAYLGAPPPAADTAARLELEFDLLARRQGQRRFTVLNDGETLASEVDDYLFVARAASAGYLYVFQVDSTGQQQWLFPENRTTGLSSGRNPLAAGQTVQAPAEGRSCFYLDARPGVEHIYAVFSASPWTALEGALSQPAKTEVEPRLAKGSQTVEEPNRLLTRGVAGVRPAGPQPAFQRVEKGQPYALPVSGQVVVASNSFVVLERWFRHTAKGGDTR